MGGMTAYFRPTPNTNLKSQALTLWSGLPFDGSWYAVDAWYLSSGVLFESGIANIASGGAPLYLVDGFNNLVLNGYGEPIIIGYSPGISVRPGFIGATTDGLGSYLLPPAGSLIYYSSGSVETTYALPTASVFTGIAYSNNPYMTDSAGNIFTLVSGAVEQIGAYSSTATAMTAANNTLYSLLPAIQSLGVFAISGAVASAVATPMTTPSCLAASGNMIAVGGWSSATLPSGFADISLGPNNAFAGISTAGTSSWAVSGSTFVLEQLVSGSPGEYVAWSPNGEWVLASDTVNNLVRVLAYSFGTLSQVETIAVTAPGQIEITPNSLWAFVACPAGVEILALTSGWGPSATIALAGCSTVLSISNASAAAGYSSGIANLTLTGSTWADTLTPLSFVPTTLAKNGSTLYAAGTNAAQIVGGPSGIYAGTAVDSFWQQGQFIVADPAGQLRVFGPQGSGYAQQNTSTAPSGATFVTSLGAIFAAGSPATSDLYTMTGPYVAAPMRYGVVSIYTSGWVSATLPIESLPEALTWDISGNIAVATSDNMLVSVSSLGTILSTMQVTQFVGQPQTTPLGLSALLAVSGSLYGATSLNDSLVQLI